MICCYYSRVSKYLEIYTLFWAIITLFQLFMTEWNSAIEPLTDPRWTWKWSVESSICHRKLQRFHRKVRTHRTPEKSSPFRVPGIIKRDWPLKYLERVPSLIVLFLDLDWDHASWEEKKTEAKSKVDSIRDTCRQGSRIALVLLQERFEWNAHS